MKTLLDIFPRASAATVAANPQMSAPNGGLGKQNEYRKLLVGKGYPTMNKTESEFALMLDAQERAGEILRYEYEGITLRWADMRYTPDFVVFESDFIVINRASYGTETAWRGIKLIEVKGGHIWDRDIVRFKGARAYWPEFAFEMWQLKKGQGWKLKY